MQRSIFVKVIGLLFLLVGLMFLFQTVGYFLENRSRSHWIEAEATVTSSEKYYDRAAGVKSHPKIVYDVVYEYTVEGILYRGTIIGTVTAYRTGERLTVKYDPLIPSESTHILKESVTDLVFGVVATLAFIATALFLTGLIPKRKHQ